MIDAPTEESSTIASGDVVPMVFATAVPTDHPEVVVVAGQPGAGTSRVASRVRAESGDSAAVLSTADLRAHDPRYIDLTRHRPIDAPAVLAEQSTAWFASGIRYALSTRKSVVLEWPVHTVEATTGILQLFTDAGFSTRVVIAASRRSESLLSATSRFLRERSAGMPARFTSREEHEAGFTGARALARALDETSFVDRVTVFSRDGSTLFDAHREDRPDGFDGAFTGLDGAQRGPISALAGAAWFGELRRATDYAHRARELSPPVASALLELQLLALHEVLPALPIREGSTVASEQERRIASELVDLRRVLAASQRAPLRPDLTAPTIQIEPPEIGGIGR